MLEADAPWTTPPKPQSDKVSYYMLKVRALYDYTGENDPVCLQFKKGDFIDVLFEGSDGWWDGILNGKRGWFPCTYVDVLGFDRRCKTLKQ